MRNISKTRNNSKLYILSTGPVVEHEVNSWQTIYTESDSAIECFTASLQCIVPQKQIKDQVKMTGHRLLTKDDKFCLHRSPLRQLGKPNWATRKTSVVSVKWVDSMSCYILCLSQKCRIFFSSNYIELACQNRLFGCGYRLFGLAHDRWVLREVDIRRRLLPCAT